MAEDRNIRIFADDLFKYLLTKRIGIKEFRSQLQRMPEDPDSNFNSHIGMSAMWHSFNYQKQCFRNFTEIGVNIRSSGWYRYYLSSCAEVLHYDTEYNVFEKLIILASVTLELSVYYHSQGNTEIIFNAAPHYSLSFSHYFKSDFFKNGGWSAWKDFASDNVKFCKEIQHEGADVSIEQLNIVCEWLRKFDQWIIRLSLKIHLEKVVLAPDDTKRTESGKQSDIVKYSGGNTCNADKTCNAEKVIEETITKSQDESRADKMCIAEKVTEEITKSKDASRTEDKTCIAEKVTEETITKSQDASHAEDKTCITEKVTEESVTKSQDASHSDDKTCISEKVTRETITKSHSEDKTCIAEKVTEDTITKSQEPSRAEDKTCIAEKATKKMTKSQEACPSEIGCNITRDCPKAREYRNRSKELIKDFKQIIALNKDSAYEQLSEIIEETIYIDELMKFCIFPDLIKMLRNSEVKMRNIDILQFVRLILKGNPNMAVYCRYAIESIYKRLDKEKSSMKEISERTFQDTTTIESCTQEATSGTKLCKQLTEIKNSISVYEIHRKRLIRFLYELIFNKHYSSTESEICNIFLNKDYAEMLLNSDIFEKLMRVTVNKPINRWENEWILSVMKLLINGSQTGENFFSDQSEAPNDENPDCSKNKFENSTKPHKPCDFTSNFSSVTDKSGADEPNSSQNKMHLNTSKAKESLFPACHNQLDISSHTNKKNLKDNMRKDIKQDLKTIKEYIIAHSTDKRLIENLKKKTDSQIVQESFKTQSPSPEYIASDLIFSTSPTIGVMLDEEIHNSKNASETSPLNSTLEKYNVEDAVIKITESKDQYLITEKQMNKESEEVSPDTFSDLSLKSTENSKKSHNLDFVSQTIKDNNMLTCTILEVPNNYAYGKVCSQESTDSLHQNLESGEIFGKSQRHENKAVSIKENPNSAVNTGKQMIDSFVESSSTEPTLHSLHAVYEELKHEMEQIQNLCISMSAKNTDSDLETSESESDNNSESEQKLENNSNIQPTLHSLHAVYEKLTHELERIQNLCSSMSAKNTDSDPETSSSGSESDNNSDSEQKLENNSNIQPTLHSLRAVYEKVKHEIEQIQNLCSSMPTKNTDSDPEISSLHSDNNSDSEQKLENNSNSQPTEVVLTKEFSNNLKHTKIVEDSNIITDRVTARSDKEIGLISPEISTKNEKANSDEMSPKKVIPPEVLSYYENASPLLPADISSDVSEKIFNEIFENNTNLSELMEVKFIMDSQLKKEILQHYNTFVESFKDEF